MLHFSLFLVLFSAIIQSSSSADIAFVIQFDKPFASTVNVSTFTDAFNALVKKQIPVNTPTVTIKKFTNTTGNTTTVDTILIFASEMTYTNALIYFNGTLNTTVDVFGRILSYSASSLTRTNIAITVKFNSTFVSDFNNPSSESYKNFTNMFTAFLKEKLTEKPVLITVIKLTNNSVLVEAILQFIGVVVPESLIANLNGLNYPVIGTVLEVTSKTATVSKIAVDIYFNRTFDVNLKTESSLAFKAFKTNFGNLMNLKLNNRVQSFGLVSIDSATKGYLVIANLFIFGDATIIDVEKALANSTNADIGNIISVTGSIPTTSEFKLTVVFSKVYNQAFKDLKSEQSVIFVDAFKAYINELLSSNKPDSITVNSLTAGSTVVDSTIKMTGAANTAAVTAKVKAGAGDPTLGTVVSANSASGTETVANSGLKQIFSSDLIKLSILFAFFMIFF